MKGKLEYWFATEMVKLLNVGNDFFVKKYPCERLHFYNLLTNILTN